MKMNTLITRPTHIFVGEGTVRALSATAENNGTVLSLYDSATKRPPEDSLKCRIALDSTHTKHVHATQHFKRGCHARITGVHGKVALTIVMGEIEDGFEDH